MVSDKSVWYMMRFIKRLHILDLDIANFEISEEDQARLLAEYEQEIKDREKGKTDDTVVMPDDIEDELAAKPKEKVAAKAAGGNKKSVQFKSATAAANTSKGKNNNKDSKSQPPQQQQKSNQQQKRKDQEKSKGKKAVNELPMQKDHFKKESESSTSDESWEKDFDM
jgi:hypothetical protein